MIQEHEFVQPSESGLAGALLGFAGGMMDAYTYLTRGGVFANAETGNIVLLGIHLSQCEWQQALSYLLPVLAYALGIWITLIIRRYSITHLHWRQITVAVELAVILIAGFIPAGRLDFAVNIMIAFVCAIQVQSFRKIRGNVLATTMCTGNLRTGTELLHVALRDHDRHSLHRAMQYYSIIFCFILGAFLCGILAPALHQRTIWLSLIPLALVFLHMFRRPA